MKKIFILTIILLAALRGGAYATFMPLNLGDYVTLNSSFTNEFGRQPGPVLSGVPFSIPNTYADFFAFNNDTTKNLTMPVDIKGASTAYLLINTNWGQYNFLSGRVVFESANNGSFTLDLVGGVNIRDWNQDQYTNTVTDPRNTPTGFTADPDMWSGIARIDLLTVQLPQDFYGDTLKSITFLDFGKDGSTTTNEYIDGASRIRIEGVTIATVPVPEPASMLLVGIVLVLIVGKKWVESLRPVA